MKKIDDMNNIVSSVDQILTVQDMAQWLKIKPGTIHSREWQRRTGCPLIKRGKRLLSVRSEFAAWLKRGLLS